jgi:hypothetical protein
MILNTTFNNISFILWQTFLLVEKTKAPGEKHTPCHEGYSNSQLYHMVVGFTTTCAISEFKFCSWQGVLDTSLSGKVCQ